MKGLNPLKLTLSEHVQLMGQIRAGHSVIHNGDAEMGDAPSWCIVVAIGQDAVDLLELSTLMDDPEPALRADDDDDDDAGGPS